MYSTYFTETRSRDLKIKIYRNIILPVVLYGCTTWSLTVTEERRLRLFDKMALGRIFEPKTDRGNKRVERTT